MTPLLIRTMGDVSEEEVRYARSRLQPILDKMPMTPMAAEAALGVSADPAHELPALAQVTVRTAGTGLRAHVSAHTVREAVDLVRERLQDKAEHRAGRHLARRRMGLPTGGGEWRHGAITQPRPSHFQRAPEERQVIRHEPMTGPELTVDEAAFDLGQLDYEFLLFRDVDAGVDSLLQRDADGTYRLTRLAGPGAGTTPERAVEVTEVVMAAPEVTEAEAIELLDGGGSDVVPFRIASGRGAVVYVRYDGHYGMITLDGG